MSAFDRIALLANAQIRHIMMDVARELQRRHGSVVHLYCWTRQEVSFYEKENADGAFASVNLTPALHNLALEPVDDPAAEVERARERERRLGRTYAALAVANRHLGRGYALGGFHHPRSRFSSGTTHDSVIRAYNAHFDFWGGEVADKGLTLLLGGPNEIGSVSRLHGIPYRRLAGSKYKNYHFWAWNEFNEMPEVTSVYRALERGRQAPVNLDLPYKLVGTVDAKFRRSMRLSSLLKRLGHHWLRRAYWRLRGYEKARAYKAMDEARMIHRHWRDGRRLSGRGMLRLEDLQGTPFLFFPLATEPEVALQQFSPEFFFQHAAIAALSRDLPAGVKLAVKESVVAVGRRPDNFYDQISELKNVVWLDIREPGFRIAQQADAVAVITGSSGFEAAITGTPVISFGAHNAYNMLPHVFHTTDLAKTGEAIDWIFNKGIDREAAKREGARFLQAVVDTSFDLGEYDYVNLQNYDQAVVARACDALERSLISQLANSKRKSGASNPVVPPGAHGSVH